MMARISLKLLAVTAVLAVHVCSAFSSYESGMTIRARLVTTATTGARKLRISKVV